MIIAAICLGIFILINAAVWLAFNNRTYPRTSVLNTSIGSVTFGELPQRLSKIQLPSQINLLHKETSVTVRISDLGVRLLAEEVRSSAKQARKWLPLANLITTNRLKAPIYIDEKTLQEKAASFESSFYKMPVDAKLAVQDNTVVISGESTGHSLDKKKLAGAVRESLQEGRKDVSVPLVTTKANITADSLRPQQEALESQLSTAVTYRYQGKTVRPAIDQKTAWLTPEGTGLVFSADQIRSYLDGVGKTLGIRVKDVAGVAATTKQSMQNSKALDLTLVHQAALKIFTYCVSAKGVDTSHLTGLRSQLQQTYNDTRGWSVAGLVEFQEVSSGCDFTAWLSAPELMPTFGAICDSTWSCRVGPNVVINFERWQNASPAWNAGGGSLVDYRHMVINHETGHWLRFGHSHCGGPGQPAPVMQQQSINLQGCVFNPWPTASETAALRRSLGI